MLTIDLKALGNQARAAAQFLASRLDQTLTIQRGQLQLTEVNDRTAKLLLNKFLRREKLEDYRVVVIHPGLIRVLEPSEKKRIPYEKPRSGAAPMTIPQYQVQGAVSGLMPNPGERKFKR